ncbi:4Fe-4S domain-containing protein [Mycobacterium kyogaense]|uniref:ferredoxin n=1 Tax=Mycobacterium kyogaense TaxID=2212479 RepID=UPI0013C53024
MSSGCIGAGLCIVLAPEHFQFSSGRAKRTERSVQPDDIDVLHAAAQGCPAAAIVISQD